jgi:bile acid-coenzyme A ligase
VLPALRQRGPDEQIDTMLIPNPAVAPDVPAVTPDCRTLTRAELDSSTNRLARAYAKLGVGVGDYVTIAVPNSIERIQAAIACWKLGAVPQPLAPRMPDPEFEGLLALRLGH